MPTSTCSTTTVGTKLLLAMAITLDGFLADLDGRVDDWLYPHVNDELELMEFFESVPVFIMGRTTYDQARTFPSWPYSGKRVCVLTHRPLGAAPAGVEARSGDPAAVVRDLEASTRGIIWHLGGGRSAQPFLEGGLVDELQLDIVPVLLGRGIPLFQKDAKPLSLELIEQRSFSTGIVRVRYRVGDRVRRPDAPPPG